MRFIIPFISSILAVQNITVTDRTDTTLSIVFGATNFSSTFVVGIQDMRIGDRQLDFDTHTVSMVYVDTATSYTFTGLTAARFYKIYVTENDVFTLDTSARTTGRAVYVNDYSPWTEVTYNATVDNGTHIETALMTESKPYGSFLNGVVLYDDSSCSDQFRLTFGCSVNIYTDLPWDQVYVIQASDDTTYDIIVTGKAVNGPGAFTFTAVFANSTDACWNNVFDQSRTEKAVETVQGNYYNDSIHDAVAISTDNYQNIVLNEIPVTLNLTIFIDGMQDTFDQVDENGDPMMNETYAMLSYNIRDNHADSFNFTTCGFSVEIRRVLVVFFIVF
jgi:hypothetical protein